MANRKQFDARRFGFCVRCLSPPGPETPLVEHHPFGRNTNAASVVFICEPCHPCVETPDGPVPSESTMLLEKTRLLVGSPALRWTIRKREEVAKGFVTKNSNGPSLDVGVGFRPPFGAIGVSGRRYYFIPPEHCDQFVETPTNPNSFEDGVGGPAGGAVWSRFKGRDQNILNKFIDLHAEQESPGVDLTVLRQD